MRNWEIKSRSRFCVSCERPFETGQVYHCLLDFGGEEPERRDYCERCWKEKNLSAEKEGKRKAYWQANFKRLYTPVEDEGIKRDVVQKLLDKYIQSEEPSHINLCYLLALLEERKKVFIPLKSTKDQQGKKIIIYEHAETGHTYLIRDPGLTLSEAEKVQNQIKELIGLEKKSGEDRQ